MKKSKSPEVTMKVLYILSFLGTDDEPFVDVQMVSGHVRFSMILFHEETGGMWLLTELSHTSSFIKPRREGFYMKNLNQVKVREGMTLVGRYANDPIWLESDAEAAKKLCVKAHKVQKAGLELNMMEVLITRESEYDKDKPIFTAAQLISGRVGVGMFLEHPETGGAWQISSLITSDDDRASFFVDSINDKAIHEGMTLFGRYGYESSRIEE